MKRILLVCKGTLFSIGLLMASGALGADREANLVINEGQLIDGAQQLQLHQAVPTTPTETEEQAFTRRNRHRAERLSRAVSQAGDNGDVARLQDLANQAHQAALDVQSHGNARFGSSGGFHYRFNNIAHAAEHEIELLQRTLDDRGPAVRRRLFDELPTDENRD